MWFIFFFFLFQFTEKIRVRMREKWKNSDRSVENSVEIMDILENFWKIIYIKNYKLFFLLSRLLTQNFKLIINFRRINWLKGWHVS